MSTPKIDITAGVTATLSVGEAVGADPSAWKIVQPPAAPDPPVYETIAELRRKYSAVLEGEEVQMSTLHQLLVALGTPVTMGILYDRGLVRFRDRKGTSRPPSDFAMEHGGTARIIWPRTFETDFALLDAEFRLEEHTSRSFTPTKEGTYSIIVGPDGELSVKPA